MATASRSGRSGTPAKTLAAEPRLGVDVMREADGWDQVLAGDAPVIEAALAAYQQGLPASRSRTKAAWASVSVALSDDSAVKVLNKSYRGIDQPTNVLSFPRPPGACCPPDEAQPIGDIVLALETVQREAGERGIALADHVRHLVVHGTLHLLGFDHDTDNQAETMERLEVQILSSLGVADPYGDD